ncbi:MAG TPA: hypothetical protein VMM85_03950 [Methylomirabilota bacterium]|nr:hypothetical protein [Methylomirabilota bacterium]
MADLQLHTLLLCDYAITAKDGKISAVGVFSQINVGRLPATHGRCFIVAILEATPGQHEMSLQIISPSGKPTLPQAPRLRIEVPPNATTANIVADLKGMKIEELGRYRIELREGDQILGSSPFLVNLVMPQPAGNA